MIIGMIAFRPACAGRAVAAAAVVFLGLAGCGGGTDKLVYSPTGTTNDIARDECEEVVNTQMRLRGYPRRPSPDTPQAKYRGEILDVCMRAKGYAPD
ncbi:hypothetical protein WCLP8_4730012 [uncultured Gammaproteobacteria bacterium]